jgi:hypothetical protein
METYHEKETPEGFCGADSPGVVGCQILELSSKIDCHSKRKFSSCQRAAYLQSLPGPYEKHLSGRIISCANEISFDVYRDIGAVRACSVHRCQVPQLCAVCAYSRSRSLLVRYYRIYEVISSLRPDLGLYFVVLTVVNGPDLGERVDHLLSGFRKINQDVRDSKRRGTSGSIPSKIVGMLTSFETTFNTKTKEWHPHLQSLLLTTGKIDPFALSLLWKSKVNDSYIVHAKEIIETPVRSFSEVIKHNLKFSDLSPEKNYEAYRVLKGRRLFFSQGLFRKWDKFPDDEIEGYEGVITKRTWKWKHEVKSYSYEGEIEGKTEGAPGSGANEGKKAG